MGKNCLETFSDGVITINGSYPSILSSMGRDIA